jgi:hypothetical protein
LRPSHVCFFFYLRHSSNWNPHRLHSEPFPPKENHNVGLLRFDDDHDHICYRFAQVQIFGGKSNVFKSLQIKENYLPLLSQSDLTKLVEMGSLTKEWFMSHLTIFTLIVCK